MMRKHLVLVTALALSFGIVGCKQDPLADYPDSVKNATPDNGNSKPEDDGVDRNSLFIEANDLYSAKEGDTLTFEIKGRTLLKNTTFEVGIDNLHDFKGATFDATTGTFSWKVPQDIVVNGLQRLVPMHLVIETTNRLAKISEAKTVNIVVLRDLALPTIKSVGLNGQFREGTVTNFDVVVQSYEEVTQPILSVVMNRGGAENGSGFVSLRTDVSANPVQSTADPSIWTFALQLNLTNADVTKQTSNLHFGLQAYSSFGMMSPIFGHRVAVVTSWLEPRTSWTSGVEFVQGRENIYSFTIMDPRDEGRVEGQFQNCMALGATCTCTGVVRSVANCTVKWTPKPSDANRLHTVRFSAFNRSTIANDSTVTRKDFTGAISVVPAPVPPSPPPSPNPAPIAAGGN